jgi:hypothetical protein
MRTFGVMASEQPPRGDAGTARAPGAGVESLLRQDDGVSSGRHHTHTLLGKRSRKQTEPRRDPAAAQHLPSPTAAQDTREETGALGAMPPAARLGRARLHPGSYAAMEGDEDSMEVKVEEDEDEEESDMVDEYDGEEEEEEEEDEEAAEEEEEEADDRARPGPGQVHTSRGITVLRGGELAPGTKLGKKSFISGTLPTRKRRHEPTRTTAGTALLCSDKNAPLSSRASRG